MTTFNKFTQKISRYFVASSTDSEGDDAPLLLQSLEERVLYSASPVPVEMMDPDAGDVGGEPNLEFAASSAAIEPGSISGTIFNDENANGLDDEDLDFEGVRVLLYNADNPNNDPLEVDTDENGFYQFTDLGPGNYYVVVDSSTVGPGGDVIAEQTFGGTGRIVGDFDFANTDFDSLDFVDPNFSNPALAFGGREAGVSDDADSLETSQHIIFRRIDSIAQMLTASQDADFGFSFNVVTHVEDGDDIQGSLRQFIVNANELDGDNVMRFVPGIEPNAGNFFEIVVDDELPTIVDAGTTLDGQAFRGTSEGLVEQDSNFSLFGLTGELVGNSGMSVDFIDAPELSLVGDADLDFGFEVNSTPPAGEASNIVIRNFAIQGFGDFDSNEGDEGAIRVVSVQGVTSSDPGLIIENNIIGTGPNQVFTAPDRPDDEKFSGIVFVGGDSSGGIIRNNFIGFNSSSGIDFRANGDEISDFLISGNDIASNALEVNSADAIRISGATDIRIINNVVRDNVGNGIELSSGQDQELNAIIEGNSILNNSLDLSDQNDAGISVVGRGVQIVDNRIEGNQTGVQVGQASKSIVTESVTISANNFSGSQQDAIDIIDSVSSSVETNNGLEPPIIASASLNADGTGIVIEFEAQSVADIGPDGAIEIFQTDLSQTTFVGSATPLINGAVAIVEFPLSEALLTRGPLSFASIAIDGDGNTSDFQDFGSTNELESIQGLAVLNEGDFDFQFGTLQNFDARLGLDSNQVQAIEVTSFAGNSVGELLFMGQPVGAEGFPLVVTRNQFFNLSFRPADFNANGISTFDFEAIQNDGSRGLTETFTFVINSINDAPVATDGDFSVKEDGVFSGELMFSDVDGDTLTVNTTPIAGPTNGIVELNSDGTFTYTPSANFFGRDSFTYEVSDSNGGTAQATVIIDVVAVNDAPVASDDTFNVDEDGVLSDQLLSNDSDIDGDTLTVNTTPIAGPTNGIVELNSDGTFTYTPDENFFGTDSFTYEVSDGNGGTDQATVSINIAAVNATPEATDDIFDVNEDGLLSDQLLSNDSDVDGDTLTVNTTPIAGPTNGIVELNSDGTFTYTPDENFFGTDSFTYEVSDGNGGTDQATVSINVAAVNDAPVATDGDFSVNEDGVFSGELMFSDVDGDTLTVNTTPVVGPDNGVLQLNSDGTFTFTSAAGFVDMDSFTFEVSDGNGGTDQATVTINTPLPPPIVETEAEPVAIDDSPAIDVDPVTDIDNNDSVIETDVDTSITDPTPSNDAFLPGPEQLQSVDSDADTLSNDISGVEVGQGDQFALGEFNYSTYVYASVVDTGLLTEQLVTGSFKSGRAALDNVAEEATLSASFFEQLDDAEQNYLIDNFDSSVSTLVTVGTITTSLGFVVGVVVKTTLMGMSVATIRNGKDWMSTLDLGLILESDDNESIETMVETGV